MTWKHRLLWPNKGGGIVGFACMRSSMGTDLRVDEKQLSLKEMKGARAASAAARLLRPLQYKASNTPTEMTADVVSIREFRPARTRADHTFSLVSVGEPHNLPMDRSQEFLRSSPVLDQ
jgi:hypothetical protein